MLSRDSVHLSEVQRDPNKYVKYKFKKKIVKYKFKTKIVKWNSFMLFRLMMMNSASVTLQVLWMSAACISLHTFQRTLRVSAYRGQRTWKKVTKLESNVVLRGTLVGTQYRNTVRKIGIYRNTVSKIDEIPIPHLFSVMSADVVSAACISLHTFQRTLRVSAYRGQRTWKKVTKLESNVVLRGTLVGTQYRNTVRKIGIYRNTVSKIDEIPIPHLFSVMLT